MTAKEYKALSVKEFTKAAEIYESDNAVLNNEKKEHPVLKTGCFFCSVCILIRSNICYHIALKKQIMCYNHFATVLYP